MTVDSIRLTTIVFDVDGTLYRQRGLRWAMLRRLLGEAARRPVTMLSTFRALQAYRHAQEVLRTTHRQGDIAAAQLQLASMRSGLTGESVARAVTRWMEEEPLPLLHRFVDPTLLPFLEAARGRGLRLGILSDYPAAAKLEALRLSSFFEVSVAAQDPQVNRFKPDPLGLIEALRRLDAKPEHALYVGDRHEVDAAVARAAGVHCVIIGDPSKVPSGAGMPAGAAPFLTAVRSYRELHTMLFPSTNEPLS